MEMPALDNVVKYWTDHPVHSVEFHPQADLEASCNSIDQLRWSDNERWAQPLYDFHLPQGAKVLDAGCGIGVCARYYARQGYQVYAVDITPTAVEITKRSFEIFGLEGQIEVGNVERLPYPSNFFDGLVSNGVIHHTPNTEQAVDEFYRVLKPGGVALCCVYYRNMLLRLPLWMLTKCLLPLLLKKTAGREGMLFVNTPEEILHLYDGNGTPIAKLYSRAGTKQLFRRFHIQVATPHYFPIRFLRGFRTGGCLHRTLDRYCGMLMYLRLEKPRKGGGSI